ncbi:hypothetical protein GW17_00029878 [Ensete ventricosum]|nr:hypothetical protein GW17_00029878 [Ensete ventricosum]
MLDSTCKKPRRAPRPLSVRSCPRRASRSSLSNRARDVPLGHRQSDRARDVPLDHRHSNCARDVLLGHRQSDRARDVPLDHRHSNCARDVLLGHRQSDPETLETCFSAIVSPIVLETYLSVSVSPIALEARPSIVFSRNTPHQRSPTAARRHKPTTPKSNDLLAEYRRRSKASRKSFSSRLKPQHDPCRRAL